MVTPSLGNRWRIRSVHSPAFPRSDRRRRQGAARLRERGGERQPTPRQRAWLARFSASAAAGASLSLSRVPRGLAVGVACEAFGNALLGERGSLLPAKERERAMRRKGIH